MGELVVLSFTDSNGNSVGSGFVSGSTISTSRIQDFNTQVFDAVVYPNPTSGLVSVQINKSVLDQVVITLTDLTGKEHFSGKYSVFANTVQLNLATCATGSYLLSFTTVENKPLGTYRVIKN